MSTNPLFYPAFLLVLSEAQKTQAPSQVGRIIEQDEIKYKKKQPWLYSNDPDFAKKKWL